MSGIKQAVVFNVSRLRSTFQDEIGTIKKVFGSGFWITWNKSKIFVTNKHNVDPTLKEGKDTQLRLENVEIELRKMEGVNPHKETQFFSINNISGSLSKSDLADVAIFCDPTFLNNLENYGAGNVLEKEDLADTEFLKKNVRLMDIASFIGYPGNETSKWWDQQWNYGVSRVINIASIPGLPFTNPEILTQDVGLVSGLSFSGSSGSVVILHAKGIKLDENSGLEYSGYVPPKVLGVMSGHWWDPGCEPSMFAHSGLSYFTWSTSILDLIKTV